PLGLQPGRRVEGADVPRVHDRRRHRHRPGRRLPVVAVPAGLLRRGVAVRGRDRAPRPRPRHPSSRVPRVDAAADRHPRVRTLAGLAPPGHRPSRRCCLAGGRVGAMTAVLAQTFNRPYLDYHALAPEIILGGVVVLLLLIDLFVEEDRKWAMSSIAGIGVLGALIPIVTLALSDEPARVMFNGAYVVDDFALVMKALFLLATYIVILLSTNYIDEGVSPGGEYSFLLLTSVLGRVMTASSRDLVSLFVALELLSIPAYMLAAWRKRDVKSNEAGMKYFLLGVFASAVMLYGMSLLYGVSGTTILTRIQPYMASHGSAPITPLRSMFILVGV